MQALNPLPKKYQLGIKQVDIQHAQLLYILDNIIKSLKKGSLVHKKVTNETIIEFKEYAKRHFSYEESKMFKIEYSELDEHKKEHVDFINKVKEFQSKFIDTNNKNISILIEMARFISEWFLNHVQKSDRVYAEFAKKKDLLKEFKESDQLSKL